MTLTVLPSFSVSFIQFLTAHRKSYLSNRKVLKTVSRNRLCSFYHKFAQYPLENSHRTAQSCQLLNQIAKNWIQTARNYKSLSYVWRLLQVVKACFRFIVPNSTSNIFLPSGRVSQKHVIFLHASSQVYGTVTASPRLSYLYSIIKWT
jgi:hypothetical protein